MKIDNVRNVKARLSEVLRQLPEDGSLVITRRGRPCAVLTPVTEDTDLETLLLAQNRRFWRLFDRSVERGRKRGMTPLKDL